jgi:hypothetical protein
LIPAGTGLERYNEVDIQEEEKVDEVEQQFEAIG